MILCKEKLAILYRAFLVRPRKRVAFIEDWLRGCDVQSKPTLDEQRNAPDAFRALFCDECLSELESLYRAAILNIRGRAFESCSDGMKALEFLQDIVATALWRHRCAVGATLEDFARDFDRLDVPDEMRRLHMEAQRMAGDIEMRLRATVRKVTGRTTHLRGDRLSGSIEAISEQPASLEIVQQQDSIYLLRLDRNGECIADTWHETVGAAKVQADFEFEVKDNEWTVAEPRNPLKSTT